jgi:hypothetical protein
MLIDITYIHQVITSIRDAERLPYFGVTALYYKAGILTETNLAMQPCPRSTPKELFRKIALFHF